MLVIWGGSWIEPAPCYRKDAGFIPLVCMSKCPWARHWTPNCSWCAWLAPCMAAAAISVWMCGQKRLINAPNANVISRPEPWNREDSSADTSTSLCLAVINCCKQSNKFHLEDKGLSWTHWLDLLHRLTNQTQRSSNLICSVFFLFLLNLFSSWTISRQHEKLSSGRQRVCKVDCGN